MSLSKIVDWFIHESYFESTKSLRKARLFVRACLLTSLFSGSYVGLSIFFEFDKGVYWMISNVVGFFVVSLLTKTRLPLILISNIYITIGTLAVVVLTYYSGGIWSAIYPWIMSTPVLALLVVDRKSAYFWSIISFGIMVWFGLQALNGVDLPVEYNTKLRALWYLTIIPGLLLILVVISMVFESVQRKALNEVEEQAGLIEEQSETLKKILKEKESIIQILSHDLRNPLANINLVAELISLEQDEEERAKLLDVINQASYNAQNLVQNVLEMDAMEQSGMKMQLKKVNAVQILKTAIDGSSRIAERKGLKLEVVNEFTELTIEAHETYLLQVFDNLLSNAIKYSNQGAIVTVLVDQTDEWVMVSFEDEGEGVKPEEEHLLFEKYANLSNKPTAGEKSVGLGLSLAKQYVDQMNGKIRFERPEVGGSKFTVEFKTA